jgi:hypothetical protein
MHRLRCIGSGARRVTIRIDHYEDRRYMANPCCRLGKYFSTCRYINSIIFMDVILLCLPVPGTVYRGRQCWFTP